MCNCPLPPDCHGSGGWHLRPVNASDCDGDPPVPVAAYANCEVAYERCPAYYAKVLETWSQNRRQSPEETPAPRRGRLRA